MNDVRERFAKVLAAASGEVAREQFATREWLSPGSLSLEIRGVGPITMPVSEATAEAIRKVSVPAPFGWRDQTLHDDSVRHTWEVARSRVKLPLRQWKLALREPLARIRESLGLPAGCELVPTLDKVLLYERGQFFRAHQDSERSDDMVASLVVLLPSQYTGGALSVSHKGETHTFKRSKRQDAELALLAFYADCQHEIDVVKSGHRVSVTFHLELRGEPELGATPVPKASLRKLVGLARQHFATETRLPVSRREEAPRRLVYLLDHEYSSRSLSWSRLKAADRRAATAVMQVADELGAHCSLALAHVQETWQCEPEDYGYDYGYRRAPPAMAADEYTLTDLIDDSVELRSWLGRDGRACDARGGHVRSHELCFNKASDELTPFHVDHEGWQGNYGNTVERWYHRAALVLWPAEHDFDLRAEENHAWAVEMLAALPSSDGDLLNRRARALLAWWPTVPDTGSCALSSASCARLMEVAQRVDDPAIALDLLARIGVSGLTDKALFPGLRALVEQRGAGWGLALYTRWVPKHARAEWCLGIDDFTASMTETDGPVRAFATQLVAREASAWSERARQAPEAWLSPKAHQQHAAVFASLLAASGMLEGRDTQRALLEQAAALSELAHLAIIERALLHSRAPSLRKALKGSDLVKRAVSVARAGSRGPERRADDCSLEVMLRCSCADCKQLHAFLSATDARLDWPLAKARRQHIHGVIDSRALPVSHVTLRQGSPHKLQLTKDAGAIRKREKAHRARQGAVLSALQAVGLARA
ncbi:MAG: 2OG-Fe(II) oxygenase [Sandaracinaceae bacterium]|nr:2OG-Fe(II) oxygenase [Sandaracinaceae bacterium]